MKSCPQCGLQYQNTPTCNCANNTKQPESDLVEGEDYYLEDGNYVFTGKYLLKQGVCCHSGCRHCPY